MFARLFDRDGIHEASGVGGVSTDFSIDFDEPLADDCDDLASSQSILESVAEENREGKGFAKFVGTRGWAGSVGAAQLVEHP